jgi:hypothetical protein
MWKDTDDDNDRMKLGNGGEIVFGKHKYPPGGLRGTSILATAATRKRTHLD